MVDRVEKVVVKVSTVTTTVSKGILLNISGHPEEYPKGRDLSKTSQELMINLYVVLPIVRISTHARFQKGEW